ncbi:MAG: hypothetical protein Q4C16_08225, partial [Eubacteriales bacterium]|nr:hypothetical protein [Eubacteriales bacterium]
SFASRVWFKVQGSFGQLRFWQKPFDKPFDRTGLMQSDTNSITITTAGRGQDRSGERKEKL